MGLRVMNFKNIIRFPSNKHVRLTKKGLDGLRAQLNHLRKEQITLCKRLLSMDGKDREEYIRSTDTADRLEVIESEVATISDILQHTDVISRNKKHSNIELGSTVFLETGLLTSEYTLVNSIEANPSEHKISDKSPLGKALLGKKERSVVSISSPTGKRFQYKVLVVK